VSHCFDTSSFIECWRTSPQDIFVTLWDRLDSEISANGIVCPEEVLIELARQDDGLHRWAKERRERLFVPLESDLQAAVARIGGVFPYYTAGDTDENGADPWVIGLAMARTLVVVTEERRPGSPDFPTIPRVCEHFGVQYINAFEYMRVKGWTF
jgi:Domain of unknown function (DUF4411)